MLILPKGDEVVIIPYDLFTKVDKAEWDKAVELRDSGDWSAVNNIISRATNKLDKQIVEKALAIIKRDLLQ